MILFINRAAELNFTKAEKASRLHLKVCVTVGVFSEEQADAPTVHQHGRPNTPSPLRRSPACTWKPENDFRFNCLSNCWRRESKREEEEEERWRGGDGVGGVLTRSFLALQKRHLGSQALLRLRREAFLISRSGETDWSRASLLTFSGDSCLYSFLVLTEAFVNKQMEEITRLEWIIDFPPEVAGIYYITNAFMFGAEIKRGSRKRKVPDSWQRFSSR